MRLFKKTRHTNILVSPEEIFLDTQNLPGFDRARFEGTLEYPIRTRVFVLLGILFFVVGLIIVLRAAFLTVLQGDVYAMRSEHNRLRHTTIVPERGIVYDRNGEPLAFNVPGFRVVVDTRQSDYASLVSHLSALADFLNRDVRDLEALVERNWQSGEIMIDLVRDWNIATELITRFKDTDAIRVELTPLRAYVAHPAFSHVIGYVSRVTKEDVEENRDDMLLWGQRGRSGVELAYDEALRGMLGVKIVETDSKGGVMSEGIYQKEERGKNITVSISSDMQKVVYEAIGRIAEERGFTGGSGVALDARSGAVLSLVSYPGFDVNVLSTGFPRDAVTALLADERKALFFRALQGLYPPASTIKPFLAAAALEENIIRPDTIIHTDGRLVVPNPYDPENPSIFHDWKNHGPVNMTQAIAFSSDVYFYTIGGGQGDQEGLGRGRIASYLKSFGMGLPTGIDLVGEKEGNIPDDAWKAERYPADPLWRLGDTYNMSIGQGGMTVTPLQMARAALALSNGGIVKTLRLIVDASGSGGVEVLLPMRSESLAIAREGMRKAVLYGTAIGVSDIPLPVAAKTGTAEIGKTGRVHSWFIGFLPWEDPELVLVINLENGSASNLVGATAVAHEILAWYTDGGRDVVWGRR